MTFPDRGSLRSGLAAVDQVNSASELVVGDPAWSAVTQVLFRLFCVC
ncbi:hypothetical protein [Arthrobacter sp. ISL-65]|nr:hypothetical protein [Arthrobacter sp. ISL-65]MBT2546852.1 hypothetical protein [Arthrobacter sp. ISL-65]